MAATHPVAESTGLQVAAVFIHGFNSEPSTWDQLLDLLSQDPSVRSVIHLRTFGYQTALVPLNWWRRMPDFDTISLRLQTFFETQLTEYERVLFITHSQGGLIVQRFIARMLIDGRARDLARIRMVVHIACPNGGVHLAKTLQEAIPVRHPQAKQLGPINEAVIAAQRQIFNRAGPRMTLSDSTCPIEFYSYSASEDGVVGHSSSTYLFEHVGSLPGTHTSVIRPDDQDHETYVTIRKLLLRGSTLQIPVVTSENQQAQLAPRFVHTTTTVAGDISTTVVIEMDSKKEFRRLLQSSPNSEGGQHE